MIMSAIVPLLITYLPKIFTAVQLLGKVPEAIETIGQLKEFTEKVIAILKRPGMLTTEQRKALDATIDSRKDLPHFQPETDSQGA